MPSKALLVCMLLSTLQSLTLPLKWLETRNVFARTTSSFGGYWGICLWQLPRILSYHQVQWLTSKPICTEPRVLLKVLHRWWSASICDGAADAQKHTKSSLESYTKCSELKTGYHTMKKSLTLLVCYFRKYSEVSTFLAALVKTSAWAFSYLYVL